MKHLATIVLPLFCLIVSKSPLLANNNLYYCAPNVHTLRTYVEGDEMSFPLIDLYGEERVVVEFDCLFASILDLEYTIQHCSNNGTPSDLQPSEYIEGFNVNSITNYESSINTKTNYVNYRIAFPNDDVKMLLSGRYIVTIFEAGNPENVVARTTFLVYEQLATINVTIIKPQTAHNERHAHDIRISADYSNIHVTDVFAELNLDILQNGNIRAGRQGLKPRQISGTQLVYSYASDLFLPGGNEFRMLDLRYLQKNTINYNRVEYIAPFFHVTPPADKSRAFEPYFNQYDQNGQYLIYANSVNKQFDDYYRTSDYAFVHNTLETEPVLDGDVFIYGAFNNWQLDSTNMMQYNFDTKRYESNLFLKQGVYDYMYVVKNAYTQQIDLERFEGSHAATSNNYLFLLFYKPTTADYEQLIGALQIDN